MRTIRNWLKKEGGPTGRPPRAPAERGRAFRRAARAWLALGGGETGWRTVRRALGGDEPVRLVQESVREIKRLDRRHRARRAAHRRVHVEVLARGVLWQQDATHLGRIEGLGAAQAEVLRDAALPGVLAASVGGAVRGRDAAAALEAAIAHEGAAPLVVGTDNGAPYRSAAFAACLERHRIVHLRNLPRTPQHNARVERVIRDVKDLGALGRGVTLADPQEAALRVAAACERLALRAALAAKPPPAAVRYTARERDRFRQAACRRIEGAVQVARTARERRLAEREAIFAELEARGLIERTRGEAPRPAAKEEIIS